ncbi:hypothetical protein DM02DRAFT_624070 [Periconia macrospinosa]|uniref:Cell wall protein PhiA n=1 Tax=Periconia macrospinosa TaxID=97972 RepID=A0A2V1E4S5_9PLEO|nr:hypothetical protein DM02DRAFT_624070 [Periconia macrospinosa]
MSLPSLFTFSMLLSSLLAATPAAGLYINCKNPRPIPHQYLDEGLPLPQQAPVPNPNPGPLRHPISYSPGPGAVRDPAAAAKLRVASGAEAEAAARAQAVAPAQAAPAAPAKAASAVVTHAKPQLQQSRLPQQTAAANSCTFRAYGVQLCDPASASPVTYLQINQILNADGSLAVDVRRQRPRAAFNSYEKLVPNRSWSVSSLEHGDTLAIRLDGDDGKIGFSYGSAEWTNEDGVGAGKAGWCETEGWNDEEEWDCGKGTKGTKSSNMVCGFPCGAQENMELK